MCNSRNNEIDMTKFAELIDMYNYYPIRNNVHKNHSSEVKRVFQNQEGISRKEDGLISILELCMAKLSEKFSTLA